MDNKSLNLPTTNWCEQHDKVSECAECGKKFLMVDESNIKELIKRLKELLKK